MRSLEKIVKDNKERRTFLIVSHHLNFAISVSDKLIGLRCGELFFHSDVDSIIESRKLDEVFDIKFDYYEDHGKRLVF